MTRRTEALEAARLSRAAVKAAYLGDASDLSDLSSDDDLDRSGSGEDAAEAGAPEGSDHDDELGTEHEHAACSSDVEVCVTVLRSRSRPS